MTIYKCECGKQEKEINKATIVLRCGSGLQKRHYVIGGKYMDSEPLEGMPEIKKN